MPSVSQYQFLPFLLMRQAGLSILLLQKSTTSMSASCRFRLIRSTPIGVVWILPRFFSRISGFPSMLSVSIKQCANSVSSNQESLHNAEYQTVRERFASMTNALFPNLLFRFPSATTPRFRGTILCVRATIPL